MDIESSYNPAQTQLPPGGRLATLLALGGLPGP